MDATLATPALGLGHFLMQSDPLAKALLLILLVMSIATWYLIITKSITLAVIRRRSARFIDTFWNASSLDTVAHEIATHGVTDPFSHLTSHAVFAREHHARFGATRLEDTTSADDFLTRTMRKVIDEETTRMERGLTVLASVGATAPFVGLFGTVWGVYHALVAIGVSGTGALNQIAGPVGEALIMTALGLAVAIPAVLGYNGLVRGNRVILARLDAFAHDLFAFLTTGQPVVTDNNVRALRAVHRAAGQPFAH